jgi:ribose transport system permease protein
MVTLSLVDKIGQVGALFAGLGLGTALGCLNGLVLVAAGATTQAKALFITFGMSSIYGAAALLYTKGASINRNTLTTPFTIYTAIGSGMIGPLSVSFVMFLCCLIILYIFQKKTYLGRTITYTGGNIVAAELGGLSTKRVMVLIYSICGFMAALSAIILFSRVPVTTPVIGRNFERDAIMAVVVGGTSLLGGRGSVLRTVLGVSLVVLMSNCMNLLGIVSNLQEVFRGAILVTAIWLDHRRHR